MPTSPDESAVGNSTRAFELALRQREFEISQLTQRNNFFMIFQGVLIAGVMQSGGGAAAVISFAVCCVGFAISLLQVGMAAGSKFWQVRWERAAKTTEILLLEEFKNHDRLIHFFTADGNDLRPAELARLNAVNMEPNRTGDPLTMAPGAGRTQNTEELALGSQGALKKCWNWVILKKFSVSRIPIYVGAFLALFWFFLLTFTVSFDGANLWQTMSNWPGLSHFSLVPFKSS